MLAELKLKTLQELVSSATREELIWINGYLAGLVAQSGQPLSFQGLSTLNPSIAPTTAEATATQKTAAPSVQVGKIAITYGTETGNAKKLATSFAALAKKKGIQVKLTGLDQYKPADLLKEEYMFSIISTQGDGEPPAAAQKFFDHLKSTDKSYPQLKYGILALGDSSYPLFCQAGTDADELLQARGANKLLSTVKCDTDYEALATDWFNQVLALLEKPAGGSEGQNQETSVLVEPVKKAGKKTYTGKVQTNINLNDAGSSKETHHIEILCEENIDYLPGDAAGFIPHNHSDTVDKILELLTCAGTEQVLFREEKWEIKELLTRKLNILYLPARVVKKYAKLVQQEIPETRIDLVNLLKIYPPAENSTLQQLVDILEPIAPRLYSIASSPTAHPQELHLTVARNNFSVNDELHHGFCSQFLNELEEDTAVDFYIHPNQHFRLPADHEPIIMIGPGTGVAPFRSFVSERDAVGASGENWLFFGEQHFVSDFLYQTEWQNFYETNVLTHIDLAFSRDQENKIYVQHKMWEKADQLYDWIRKGAYLYVCGAKEPMSVDVEETLVHIISEKGQISLDAAREFLLKLQETGRYNKDVY